MIPLYSVATMRERDAATIAAGISGVELMKRAGVGIFGAYPWGERTAIVCGSGNNAGDGYVLALLLQEAGKSCTLFRLTGGCSPDGGYYLEQCRARGIPMQNDPENADFSDYDTIVDCIFGTGFHGNAEGTAANMIERINQSGKPVVSVDINSGLDGDNGRTRLAVRSELTVSIGSYQPGLFLGDAKDHVKAHTNIDIGISMPQAEMFLTECGDFSSILRPRPASSHKGNYGYVAIVGGCPAYSGAVKLANLSAAALRAGCGVAQLAVPDSIAASVAPYLLESTLLSLPSDESGAMRYDAERLDAILSRHAAVSVGMGWGQGRDAQAILTHLLTHGATRLIIDADGLNTLSRMDPSVLKRTPSKVVLTPHLKEFERLSGVPIEELLKDPIRHARNFAAEYGVCLLLKGCCTVVTDGKETLLVNRGSSGMATAGSGDVLSGILTGILGYNEPTPLSVACGAAVAGVAGELAAKEVGEISMIASDTVSQIPRAIRKMTEADRSEKNK